MSIERFKGSSAVRLDLGCGKNKRIGFIGVDISPDSDADIVCDVVELPIKDMVVSDVYCFSLVEHLFPDEAFQLFAEIHRVLKSGGKVAMRVDRDWSLRRLLKKDSTHKYRYTEKQIDSMIGGFSFKDVKQRVLRFGLRFRKKIWVVLVK